MYNRVQSLSVSEYDIISQILVAFWLILVYDLLEDIRLDDVVSILFCSFII